jgi:hypothetical protein
LMWLWSILINALMFTDILTAQRWQ